MNGLKKAIVILVLVLCMGLCGCNEKKKQDSDPLSTTQQEVIMIPTFFEEDYIIDLPEVDVDALEGHETSSENDKPEEVRVTEETTVPEETQREVLGSNGGITLPEIPIDEFDSEEKASEIPPSEEKIEPGSVIQPNEGATEAPTKEADEMSDQSGAELPSVSLEGDNKKKGETAAIEGKQETANSDGAIEMPEITLDDENE